MTDTIKSKLVPQIVIYKMYVNQKNKMASTAKLCFFSNIGVYLNMNLNPFLRNCNFDWIQTVHK
jgi:hypothetical protein